MTKSRQFGFTLIELLIVVAIIAILAAIAVPNFLEAQVRSKVSRVKSDLRSFATALESYTVDNNVPPPAAGERGYPRLTIEGRLNQSGILTPAITTPIAYMTTFLIYDPFMDAAKGDRPDERLYTYQTYTWRWKPKGTLDDTQGMSGSNEGPTMTGIVFKDLYGGWRLLSVGPDHLFYNNFARTVPASVGLPYDPTNGTNSIGNILRSQKEPSQTRWLIVNGQ